MDVIIPPQPRDGDLGILYADELNEDVCNLIIETSLDLDKVKGRINSKSNKVVELSQYRDVSVYPIPDSYDWIDDLIYQSALTANDVFNVHLSGLVERPQLLRYKSPSNGYDWHSDLSSEPQSSMRKISISIILNDGYEGGDMKFFNTGEIDVKTKKGDVIAFPSFMPHKIMPVTSGERWALVAFISGEPYR